MTRYNDGRERALSTAEYRALAQFRYHIRRFLRFSEKAARESGLETQQYQLMLAIKAEPAPPTVGEIAERMQIQHHSGVELVNRCEQNGLVKRTPSDFDRRKVYLDLTPEGERLLKKLARHHRAALSTMAPMMLQALEQISKKVKRRARRKSHQSRTARAE
ncbi:MAG: MarR family transcriptional regulator [Acidobacteria bacterium]|nr:MarR family transcriptional regulator [Acidobacteriota bacterium]